MGIQRLGARLRDFGEQKVLGRSDSDLHSTAIIDGPGLAHYIYYKTRDSAGPSQTVLYSTCVKTTIDWLNALENVGYTIAAIMFDGALPITKKGTRIDRLQGYISRLQAYKHQSGDQSSASTKRARKALPPAPFLVFAIVEGLLSSTYSSRTFVVPGEADPFCIAAAKDVTSTLDSSFATIFSDDSDLLVYHTDARTRVVTFRELFDISDDTGKILSGIEYTPSEIARSKGCNPADLVKPAYFMSKDVHCSLDQAVRRTIGTTTHDHDDFESFASLFQTANEELIWASLRSDVSLRLTFARRDSRVSELMYQLSSQSQESNTSELNMFLPFLLEDPSRATAWTLGIDVRNLAHTMLLKASHRHEPLIEYRRSGERINAITITSFTDTEFIIQSQAVMRAFNSFISDLNQHNSHDRIDDWRFAIMCFVLNYLYEERYALPTKNQILMVLNSSSAHKDWFIIHLSAQYQAMYYSFRILTQALASATAAPKVAPARENESIDELRERLLTLPSISTFFQASDSSSEAKWTPPFGKILNRYNRASIGEGREGREGHNATGTKRKQHKVSKDGSKIKKSESTSVNRYALLAG